MGGCPVDHGKTKADTSRAPPLVEAATPAPAGGGSSCPVSDVNPLNAMPPPNQRPAPGQRDRLDTRRVESTIPTGKTATEGDSNNWMYPSQQMFFNAMRRKGYDPKEEDMRAVVAIHNVVNERTWWHIREWEAMLHPECLESLRLLRFEGKPNEPTPKARALQAVGYTAPFDRHDWVVQRCGKEVTYLIDFYKGQGSAAKPVAFHIDARPAADDASGVWDRLRYPLMRLWRAGREEE